MLHEGPELVFVPARLEDNDEYICRPTNQVGDGTPTTWKFIVNGEYNFPVYFTRSLNFRSTLSLVVNY